MGTFPNQTSIRAAHGAVFAERPNEWQVVRLYLPALAVHVGNQHRMETSVMLPAGAA